MTLFTGDPSVIYLTYPSGDGGEAVVAPSVVAGLLEEAISTAELTEDVGLPPTITDTVVPMPLDERVVTTVVDDLSTVDTVTDTITDCSLSG